MSRVVRAAGAVLWRRPPGSEVEVAVVHRPHHDDWSLPKGKVDPGETSAVTAVREVHEETGYEAALDRFLTVVEYAVPGADKTVEYFAARAVAGGFVPNEEVDELRWLPPAEARALLTFDNDARVVDLFAAQPAEVTTLLLVRHAKAGNRENWTGDDDLRPLSEAGVRQARGLRTLLRAFAPDRVVSAPRLRCVQTVQAVADDVGVETELEHPLSEEGYTADRAGGLARVLSLVAAGGTPVVCSQGGVIPDVVAMLAERDGITVPRKKSADVPPSKKGSVWVLAFARDDSGAGTESGTGTDSRTGTAPERVDGAGPRLVTAHYLPSPLPEPLGDEAAARSTSHT
ncbi:NUDIX hydrolase [Saccharomonospora halophila]|uniref:NUDIX hydrolase n=1 Tax=Saccharomonospora halophila TaxID=129922 RepID=UPI0003A4D940|nr:NUDIX hydrolase [Saccharomonospora halophila]